MSLERRIGIATLGFRGGDAGGSGVTLSVGQVVAVVAEDVISAAVMPDVVQATVLPAVVAAVVNQPDITVVVD